MQCQILFSGKNKKNISKCRLLKILPTVLSVKIILNFVVHKGIEYTSTSMGRIGGRGGNC